MSIIEFFKRFFWNQNVFTYINLFSFVVSIYVVYKNFFEKAKISLHLADKIGIIADPNTSYLKIHLQGVLVNKSVKVGVLNCIELELKTPRVETLIYDWNIFFDYRQGTLNLEPAGHVMPISVNGRDSKSIYVELAPRNSQILNLNEINTNKGVKNSLYSFSWVTTYYSPFKNSNMPFIINSCYVKGNYRAYLKGWVNKSTKEKPNIKYKFNFELKKDDFQSFQCVTHPNAFYFKINMIENEFIQYIKSFYRFSILDGQAFLLDPCIF